MKRLTALTVALLIGVTMFAQQALWGTTPVVSPEIHDNNTVTFRFKAPKAVRVQLTGDFLPVQKNAKFEAPGIVDLKEGQEGVWEYTTPEPLKPELYSYSFIVDGLRMNDPANVYLIRVHLNQRIYHRR
jgi:1,4-alpha-glucan branching enzyme